MTRRFQMIYGRFTVRYSVYLHPSIGVRDGSTSKDRPPSLSSYLVLTLSVKVSLETLVSLSPGSFNSLIPCLRWESEVGPSRRTTDTTDRKMTATRTGHLTFEFLTRTETYHPPCGRGVTPPVVVPTCDRTRSRDRRLSLGRLGVLSVSPSSPLGPFRATTRVGVAD